MKTAKTEFGVNLTFKMKPLKGKSKLVTIPTTLGLPPAQIFVVMWLGT